MASVDVGIDAESRRPFPNWFATAVTAGFFVAALVNILHHEMWRDELEAWMIARYSGSLFELVRNMRYEGHPPLWFLLLYAITRFTKWVTAMQLLNVAIATCTTYFIAAYSPFTRLQRVLLCFGYYPLYEYGTISRNYGLGVLFLFWFCATYHSDRKQNWITSAVLLALLANTSVYGTMMALAFAFSLFAVPAIVSGSPRRFFETRADHILAATLIFCASIALAIAQMNPPPDIGGYAVGWHLPTSARSIAGTLTGLWAAFVPIPTNLAHFWNSNLFFSRGRWAVLGSSAILLMAFLLLVRKRYALLAYATATCGMLLFMHVKFNMGYARHLGHLFLVFVACRWIGVGFPDEPAPFPALDRISRLLEAQSGRILNLVLCVQLAVAAAASWIDWVRPFSQGKSAAAFLRTNGMAGMFMVGDVDYAMQTVAGYLDRQIYYTRGGRMGSFVVWDQKRLQSPPELLAAAADIARSRGEKVVMISNRPLAGGAGAVHELARFTGSIQFDENFYLYLVDPG